MQLCCPAKEAKQRSTKDFNGCFTGKCISYSLLLYSNSKQKAASGSNLMYMNAFTFALRGESGWIFS
jgi:hypothetical protein